ncbi:MAG: archaemetzincin [Bacteroidia bacterium]
MLDKLSQKESKIIDKLSPKESKMIDKLSQNDLQLEKPKPGDWLYENKEPGQSFREYINSSPVTPNQKQCKIYLQPIGVFSKAQQNVIALTADYLQRFFNLTTVVADVISDTIIPKSARRTREDGSVQLLATYILDSVLKNRLPPDAIVCMAVTEKDLYPAPSWNFVFGLSTFSDRIGVSSIYRYSTKPLDSSNYSICLDRLTKTSAHEIGHMFYMHHCIHAACIMNGSNNLAESDAGPNRLCSECVSKLYWNLKFDIRKRLENLNAFFLKHNLKRDYEISKKDLKLIE